ncbi:MAG: glycosyltransferase [Gemmatimonadota bacterium]|nr:glycosyltransferase [Gemmatimonadota bacterium]
MQPIAIGVVAAALALLLYTYAGYPLLLALLARLRSDSGPAEPPADDDWPRVSISVPAYNEEDQIRDLVKSLLALDYPRDRLQLLIISDASSDRTDEIVREYEDDGVELLRLTERGGKTRAENAAAKHLRGDIIVNTDASIRIRSDALKPLIARFGDPEVGCASGRDVSVGADDAGTGNAGEGGYVGYEMGIRELETRVGGIIGASGCFYAIRPELHRLPLPGSLSRDFAAALHTHEHGYRAESVSDAVCFVPRASGLRKEYRRKVRTITRGMQTLWYKRALMNPFRHGLFAWKLFSHKVCRWALPWAALAAFAALGVLAPASAVAAVLFGLGTLLLVLAATGWALANRPHVPSVFSIPAYLVTGNLAAAHAFLRAVSGGNDALWEPTRRHVVRSG